MWLLNNVVIKCSSLFFNQRFMNTLAVSLLGSGVLNCLKSLSQDLTDFERAESGLRILLQLFRNRIYWVLSVRFLWHIETLSFEIIF